MSSELQSILVGTAGLGVVAAVTLGVAVRRSFLTRDRAGVLAAARVAVVAVLLQLAHFGEELATGFHRKFPELLGLAAWPTGFFVGFNLVWLLAWTISSGGLLRQWRWTLFPLWFLALAGCANGIAHPLLSLRVGGYFPGLFTSPMVGIAGFVLARSLLHVTSTAEVSEVHSRNP